MSGAEPGRDPYRRARMVAVGLPLVASLIDAAATVAVVVDAGRCGLHCTGGLLTSLVAPTSSPLVAVGLGEPDAVHGAASVALAFAVAIAVLTAWWWFAGGLLARLTTRPRSTGETISWWRFALGYVGALVATFVVKACVSGVYLESEAAGSVVELIIWTVVLWFLTRVRNRTRPPG